jgi:hypothetical protein
MNWLILNGASQRRPHVEIRLVKKKLQLSV